MLLGCGDGNRGTTTVGRRCRPPRGIDARFSGYMLTGQGNSGAEAVSDGLSGSSFKVTCEYGRISLRIFYPRWVAGGRSQAKGTFRSPERSYYGGFRYESTNG